jgi:hypothetical protein
MTTTNFLKVTLPIIIILVIFSGCGPKLTKVTGQVTIDGKPVDGATVTFAHKDNSSIIAIGTTDTMECIRWYRLVVVINHSMVLKLEHI